ncbi:RNA polymerase III transcription factor IIIC subunit-domain-containing protein [Gaertneriomyces semiglobifer]|nr:RNA polymerase III transcription factor IIIC subunit-domain-containing protein [Gaertneriomyces semiglobifer]
MMDRSTAEQVEAEQLRAPSQSLPGWKFHVVEYPGYVENTDKALKTLGGTAAIERAFNEDLNALELRYRPDDPFSHPIQGEIITTANLLLKVTLRRKKRRRKPNGTESPDPGQITHQVLGTISKTCRFRAIADFQWISDLNDPMVKLRRSMQVLDPSAIEEFTLATDRGPQKDLRNMPPPAFSRIEWPLEYAYRQNLGVVKVLVQKDGQSEPEVKLVNRYKKVRFIAHIQSFVKGNNWKPPTVPPAGIRLDSVDPEGLATIRRLFDERPIWTRLAVSNTLPSTSLAQLRGLLPVVAYVALGGPWRDCWIRYGYDPRLDREARFYQVLEVRFYKERETTARFARAKRLRGVSEAAHLLSRKTRGPEANVTERPSHIFDGTVVRGDLGGLIQLCDLDEPTLRRMVNTKSHIRARYDVHDGWYTGEHMSALRDAFKRKVLFASGEDVDSNYEWTDGPEVELPEVDDVFEDSADAEGDDDSVLRMSRDLTQNTELDSKVDQLMRSLQAAQNITDVEVEGMVDDEDAVEMTAAGDLVDLDYYDVFGDDDDEDEDDAT